MYECFLSLKREHKESFKVYINSKILSINKRLVDSKT